MPEHPSTGPADLPNGGGVTKSELRSRQRQVRASVSAAERAERDSARTSLLLGLLDNLGRPEHLAVALYLSRAGEPDTIALARTLWARGTRLLVPAPGELAHPWTVPAWALYSEPLAAGPRGIPVAPGPTLEADALLDADVVILPGLAGATDGTRLGTGGGWYDQALQHASPGAALWLLLDDADVLSYVPSQPHDIAVHRIITASGCIECSR